MIKINDWSTTSLDNNPYLAPELKRINLQGKVYNHPRFDDGSKVTTSSIIKVEGRIIHTKSDSIYKLRSIDKNFRKWLKKNRPDWDYKKPIIML